MKFNIIHKKAVCLENEYDEQNKRQNVQTALRSNVM